MATYVLVHGAWGGAHIWRYVRRMLHDAGHDVFTPSLTGVGERAHLTSPQVTLHTHVLDVANTMLYEDLRDVVLLGFSYGGMVVTGALAHVAERVRHLVYLDAFVPRDGESLSSLRGQPPLHAGLMGSEWLVPPIARHYEGYDETRAAWEAARRSAQPAGCFDEPVRLDHPLEQFGLTRTYVKATGEPRGMSNDHFWAMADRYGDDPAWRYREIATNHMIPVNEPRALTEILLELASELDCPLR